MSRPTWAEMRDEAIIELRNRTDISSRVQKWLREAALEVAYSYRFYELESSKTFDLSVNADEVTFAQIGVSDLKHILSIRDTDNSTKLTKASFRWLDRKSIGSGTPTHYCRYGTNILFDAKPSSSEVSYKLRYRKQIAEPNFSGSATPETPSEWDEVIRLLAVKRGHMRLFEPDMADTIEAEVVRLIAKLPTDEFVEAEDDDFGITPRS